MSDKKDETTTYHFGIARSLLERFKAKQPYISLPDKLRRLIERYVNNEVELEDD